MTGEQYKQAESEIKKTPNLMTKYDGERHKSLLISYLSDVKGLFHFLLEDTTQKMLLVKESDKNDEKGHMSS